MRGYPGKEYCTLIDHSGNYLRFQDQWDELYSEGVSELDDGAEKVKPEPTKEEKEAAKCPKCGALWETPGDTCLNCGHTHKRRNEVIAVPGEMVEITTTVQKEKYSAKDKKRWYAELLGYAKIHSKSESYALAIFREKFGEWPYNKHKIQSSDGQSTEVLSYIRSRNIAWAKRVRK